MRHRTSRACVSYGSVDNCEQAHMVAAQLGWTERIGCVLPTKHRTALGARGIGPPLNCVRARFDAQIEPVNSRPIHLSNASERTS